MLVVVNPLIMMCSTVMIMSTFMALTSANWLFLWVSLELNMLSFLPMVLITKTNKEIEGSVKYFLAQAFGSAMLLMASSMLWTSYNIFISATSMLLVTSILLKLGSAPCHFWYPSVMSSISWASCAILSTWQKLAPLSMLVYYLMNQAKLFIPLMAGLNALMGGILGMNQSQLRSIMAYSSIGHLGWMMSLMLMEKPFLTMVYFTIYCSLVLPMFSMFYYLNTKTSKQMNKIASFSIPIQMSITMLFISLGGLPPMTGFMPKLLVIQNMMSFNSPLMMMLILGSMMNLYFYLNIIMNIFTSTKEMTSWPVMNLNKPSTILILSGVLSLGLAPMLMIYAVALLDKP